MILPNPGMAGSGRTTSNASHNHSNVNVGVLTANSITTSNMGVGFLYDPNAMNDYIQKSIDEWIKQLFNELAVIMDMVEAEVDKMNEIERGSSYGDRCIRDLKALGYDRLQEAIADAVLGA